MVKKIITILTALSIIISGIFFFKDRYGNKLQIIKEPGDTARSYAIYTKDGDILYTHDNIEIGRLFGGSYIVKSERLMVKNPVGIVENPPSLSIMDIKEFALNALDKDMKVLILYIDGLGYHLYEKAAEAGNLPYLSTLGRAMKALTVYPPITDVTFASMTTGKTPKHTGIHSRENKPLLPDTMFDRAARIGKSSKVIEGNIKIITDEVETILNIDENKDGTIDDEIYQCAMKEVQNPPDILLVHFHSYDDAGHNFGPDSSQAILRLKVLDSYIEDIAENFAGTIIITSDHGMHDGENGGIHGVFQASDMFIPIILKEHNR